MIKKISAVVLALVLCLSVIVVPASAAKVELGSAKMAFSLAWDKASYSAGDTAYLSIYMDAADDLPLYTGSFIIGLNSAVFKQADNPIANVKANATTSDNFASYWKGADTNLSWLAAGVVTRVKNANTAEENAKFDQYLKYTAAKNGAGTHTNAGNNMDGFYGNEFNADEPIMTIALKVAADVPDGTAVEAAMTSGSLTVSPVQTSWLYYTAPNSATSTTAIAATDIDVSATVISAKIGAPSIIKDGGSQIRFRGISQTGTAADYQGEFDVRTVAKISEADFAAKFTDEATAIEKITDIGFVYARTSKVADFNLEKAKQVAQGADIAGYTKKQISHIQHTAGNDYQFTCLVENIPDADKTDSLNALAYVCFNGEWIFADAKIFADFTELYGRMPQ